MILCRKLLSSIGFPLIYTNISKNSYWLFSLTEDVAHEMCQNNDSGKWSHRLDKAPREWAALHTSLVPTSLWADPAVMRITWGGAWHSPCPLNLFCVAIGVMLWTFVLKGYISRTDRLLTFSNCKLKEDFYWCAGDKDLLSQYHNLPQWLNCNWEIDKFGPFFSPVWTGHWYMPTKSKKQHIEIYLTVGLVPQSCKAVC